jgi:hypothetical protein
MPTSEKTLIQLLAASRIWNYEEGQTVNQLDKHTGTEKGISRMCLMNELDDSLLLVASSKSPNVRFRIPRWRFGSRVHNAYLPS